MAQIITPNQPIILSRENLRVQGIRAAALSLEHLPDSLTVSQWITIFDPFVKETIEGGIVNYELDVEKLPAAVATSAYADNVRMSCAAFNALPEGNRMPSARPESVEPGPYDLAVGGACVSGGNVSTYWWGVTFYLNHCLCNDVEGALAAGAGATGITAAILQAIPAAGQVAGAVLGAIAATLAGYSAWMQWADTHCNNSGIDVSTTWVAPTPWVKAMC